MTEQNNRENSSQPSNPEPNPEPRTPDAPRVDVDVDVNNPERQGDGSDQGGSESTPEPGNRQ